MTACPTCLDLDSRMKGTESDYEWNELLIKLENHKAEVHSLSEDDEEIE